MTAESVERTLRAAEDWLSERDEPESTIARHEASPTAGAEGGPAGRWIRRILDLQEPDGSWRDDLLATTAALLTIHELREAAGVREQDPGIGRGLDWIRGRRGKPGTWADGCTADRHERGFCHHFIGGFFSPATPDTAQDGKALRCGVAAISDSEGRFLASATALRCVLDWAEPGTDSRLHLQGLRAVVRAWSDGPLPDLAHASLLAAIQALLRSEDPADLDVAAYGLGLVARRQRGDGSWVGIDPFQALEVFLEAETAGVCAEQCHRALWHGARLLIATQKSDGSWGGESPGRRALIGCRTLRRVDPPTL